MLVYLLLAALILLLHYSVVEYGDISTLSLAIDEVIGKCNDKLTISEVAKGCYSERTMMNSYLHVYQELIGLVC